MLPSIEKLMEEFSVARVTVRQAVRLLSDEGLVSPHRGRGTLINGLPAHERSLRVHTTFAGLVDMYRDDKPVVTNLVESDASPVLLEGDGIAAPSYVHMRRVHARRGIKYCVISFYIDARVFRMAPDRFRNEVVLPVLYSLPEVEIADGRQTMHISRADVEVAACLEVPVGEPMADVRRVLVAPDGVVIYVAEVSYRGEHGLGDSLKRELMAHAEEAGLLSPHVGEEWGGVSDSTCARWRWCSRRRGTRCSGRRRSTARRRTRATCICWRSSPTTSRRRSGCARWPPARSGPASR